MQIRVTKEFRFEMAHALLGYDGPCKNIHGHSYQLAVTLKGKPINNELDSKNGMVVDFADIKKLVTAQIIQPFDHALVLNKETSVQLKSELQEHKLLMVAFQPTCENMLIHFVEKIKNALPPELTLHHLFLRETSTSFAEWYAEDNVNA
ncbi:MAG TPA: 6-carboxytetrahydropterin synthase [Bacteroidia bacterium]|nr:6-carboxytetrahydropterin synthase [Bacteroidia bacterium]